MGSLPSEQITMRSLISCRWNMSCSGLDFPAFLRPLYGWSVRPEFPFPSRLSAVSMEAILSAAGSLSYTLYMTFIASLGVANAVLTLSLSSTCAPVTVASNASSSFGTVGDRGWTAIDDKPTTTGTDPLLPMPCFLLFLCNFIFAFLQPWSLQC